VPDVPLTGDQIGALVDEVAEEMPELAERQVVIVVGGSLLAWHGLRTTTADVDTVARVEAELASAVRRVADRHGLAPKWLNDGALPSGHKPWTKAHVKCCLITQGFESWARRFATCS